jgi:hypothetical protein
MKKINEDEYTTSLGGEEDGTSTRKPYTSNAFKAGGISSYDPETGRVKFEPIVKTPFRKLAMNMKETLVAFEEAAKFAADDEQVDFLFKAFKRTARSLATHIKKKYPNN